MTAGRTSGQILAHRLAGLFAADSRRQRGRSLNSGRASASNPCVQVQCRPTKPALESCACEATMFDPSAAQPSQVSQSELLKSVQKHWPFGLAVTVAVVLATIFYTVGQVRV